MGQEVGLWLGMSDNDFRRRRVQAQTLLLLPALLLVYIRSFVFSPPPSQFFFLFFFFDAASARAFCVKFNAAKVVCEMRCARRVVESGGSKVDGAWLVGHPVGGFGLGLDMWQPEAA